MNVWTNIVRAAVWIAFSGRLVETPMGAQKYERIMGTCRCIKRTATHTQLYDEKTNHYKM